MTRLQRCVFLCTALFLILAGTLSCAGTSSGKIHALTDAEKDAITAHIRKFLAKNKTLRLSGEEFRIIQNTKPKYTIHYDGYKRGFMYVRWQLPAQRAIILQRTGNLMGNTRSDWMIRLVNDKTKRQIPSHFFGANGEDISLPRSAR